ncbi:MAG: hypothetical protein AAFO07_26440 [Bacteroidota bacterium]
MNTIKVRSHQIIVIMAMILLIGTQMMANVRVYQFTDYQGKAIECKPGEHSIHKFSKLFYGEPYCSIKVPSGYLLDVSYYGRGWKKGTYKTYTNSVSRLSIKFKNIRVRKLNNDSPQDNGDNYNKPDCGSNWVVQFYQSSNYKGKFDCYPEGKHKYASSFRAYPKSIKVKKGYELLLMSRGRQVKKITSSTGYARVPRFDYILMNKVGASKPPAATKPSKPAGCGSNWVVQFYEGSSYKGKYDCYTSGKHKYAPSFRTYPKSIKVKKGYELLLMSRGRQVKKITSSTSYARLPRFDYILMKKADNQSGGNAYTNPNGGRSGADNNRKSGGMVKFYRKSGFTGEYDAFISTNSSITNLTTSFSPQAVEVQKGYEITLYHGSRVKKIITGMGNDITFKFDKFSIRKIEPQEVGGLNCGSNWGVQACRFQNFSGQGICFPLGEHPAYSFSSGLPKSIKLRRGYVAIFMKNGKVVNSTSRSIKNISFQYDKLLVKTNRNYIEGPVSRF